MNYGFEITLDPSIWIQTMKILVPALAAVMLIGAVATATPAEAKCWWNGYSWQCASRQNYNGDRWRNTQRYQNNGRHSGGGWRHNGGAYSGGGYGGGYNSGGNRGWGYNR